jgi:hypothetical protein
MAGVSFSLPLKPASQQLMGGGGVALQTKPILARPLHCRASAAEILEVVENEPILELTWTGLLSEMTTVCRRSTFFLL